jgi:hypothetical protein
MRNHRVNQQRKYHRKNQPSNDENEQGEPVNLIGRSGYRLEDVGAGRGLGKSKAGRNRKEKDCEQETDSRDCASDTLR